MYPGRRSTLPSQSKLGECLIVRVLFFLLSYVGPCLGNVLSCLFPESMPEIMECCEVSRLHDNHPDVSGSPNVGILSNDRDVLRQIPLELIPLHSCLFLVCVSQFS